ncbi:Unknown protein [Striga hermonthica]|uniref:Uncharacterized protein n=1 Tax=Striga hermonthica TaxID=68872 RepID=A0A9N7RI85_STRHE|nr:Unknown protein [Striga hermonthica]
MVAPPPPASSTNRPKNYAPALHDQESDYPIVLNPDPILSKIKPESYGPKSESHVKKATGWEISQSDNELIELGRGFFKKLRRKLKDTNSFRGPEFLDMVTSYLENSAKKRDVRDLVAEGCIVLEVWDVLEALIVNGLINHGFASNLGVVGSLAAEARLCGGLANLAERLRDEHKGHTPFTPQRCTSKLNQTLELPSG